MNIVRKMCYFFGERLTRLGEIISFKGYYKSNGYEADVGFIRRMIIYFGDFVNSFGRNLILFSTWLITRKKSKAIENARQNVNFKQSALVLEGMFELPRLVKERDAAKERQILKAIVIEAVDKENNYQQCCDLLARVERDGDEDLIQIVKACMDKKENDMKKKRGGCEVQTGCFRRADCSEDTGK